MKASLASVLIGLQLLTAGLVVGLLVRRNASSTVDSDLSAQLSDLTAKLNGAVSQSRQIVNALDKLREDAAGQSGGASSTGSGNPTDQAKAAAPPRVLAPTYPEASAALEKLKDLHRHLREDQKAGKTNIAPIKTSIENAKRDLLGRGEEAVYVVGNEIDLQPFERTRDPRFDEYLLDEVVPAFAAPAKESAFRIARGALVRATNEAPVKFAAARALQRVDSQAWVKEVIDVVAMGSADEVDLRAQLLGLFVDAPRPEVVELCKRFVESSSYPLVLRTKAIQVLEKQDSGGVNVTLRRVVFDEPAELLKNHALDSLMVRLKQDPAECKKLLNEVLAIDPARLSDMLRDKAQALLKDLEKDHGPK